MYPLGDWAVDGVLSNLFPAFAVMEAVGVSAEAADDIGYASTASDYFFQLMFCAATASIVSGTLAERIKLWPFLVFTFMLTALFTRSRPAGNGVAASLMRWASLILRAQLWCILSAAGRLWPGR